MKLLVANRGEIAIRIIRAAAELDIPTVAVYPQDDAGSLHTGKADEAVVLPGIGRNAYLDIDEIIAAAKGSDCDAIHPGCGFLAEHAEFARRCDQASLTFIGPPAEVLDLLGDKGRMQAAAIAVDLAVQQDNPDDYVIGTGQQHSVEDFAKLAFSHVDLDYHKYIKIDQKLIRPAEVDTLLADYSKAKKILKWEPKNSIKSLIKDMINYELNSILR